MSDEIKVVRVSVPRAINPNATLLLNSSGDNNDATSFTPNNSGIKQVDLNSVETLRVWTDGSGENVVVSNSLPSGLPGVGSSNTIIGADAASNITGNTNVAVGTQAARFLTSGTGNTFIGRNAGQSVQDGTENVAIGDTTDILEPSASQMTIIGAQSDADVGVLTNSIVLGYLCTVQADNTILIGNSSNTIAYFGRDNSGTGPSTVTIDAAGFAGKGDAIVFPDADPHIVGAGYWVAGVLTRSNG